MSHVTLHVVSLSPFVSVEGKPGTAHATFEYARAKNTLTAVETDDGRPAPYGLRRVRMAELPKVGGFTGLAVAALTKKEAVSTLLRVATKEHQRAYERAAALAKGIAELSKAVTP